MPWSRSSALVNIAVSGALAAIARGAPAPQQPVNLYELRDIAPPVELPPDPVWHWYAGGALLLLAGAAWAVRIVRRRRAAAEMAAALAPSAPRAPHEAALEDLLALASVRPSTFEEHKAYYTRLADVLRAYIAGRFGVESPDSPASELLSVLFAASPDAGAHREVLTGLFSQAELVKFAAHLPGDGMPQRAVETARAFVRETSVAPPVAAAATLFAEAR